MTTAAPAYDPAFTEAGNAWGVDPNLLRSIATVESGGARDPTRALSPAGAQGLMQFMPGTAQAMGLANPYDPVDSIWAGAKLMRGLLDKYNDVPAALSAYNAGEQRVDDYLSGQGSLPAETQRYVPKIGAALARFSRAAPAANSSVATAAAPGSYQVAAADASTRSDVGPSPFAPPSGAAGRLQRPSDDAMMQALAGGASVSSPGAGGAASAAPAPSAPSAAPRPSDDDMMRMLTGGGADPAAASPSAPPAASASPQSLPADPHTALIPTGPLHRFAAGATDAASNLVASGLGLASRVDQAVPFLRWADSINPLLGSVADQQAKWNDLIAAATADEKQNAGSTAYKVGRLAGDVAMTAPFMEVAAGPLGLGAAALASGMGRVVPAAGTAVRLGTDFLGGTTPATGNKLVDLALRVPALVTNGALQGGVAGALTTGDTGGDWQHNALIGAAMGGTLGPVIPAAVGAAKYVKNALLGLTGPFSAAGRNRLADAVIADFAKGGPTAVDSAQLVTGSAPTLAQATANPGIAAAERAVSAVRPNDFTTRAAANNDARVNALASLTGTPTDVETAEAARGADGANRLAALFGPKAAPATAGTDYAAATRQPSWAEVLNSPPPTPQAALAASTTSADADPRGVVQLIDSILASPSGQRDAVISALSTVRDKLVTSATRGGPATYQTDPAQLYGVRQALTDMLSPLAQKAGTSDARLAAAELGDVKTALDNTIEAAAPGFKDYLAAYAQASKPIDAMRYLQSKGFTDASGNVTLAKVKGVLDDIAKQHAMPGPRDAKSLPQDTIDGLQALYADLKRANNSRLGMSLGSNTFQNLAVNEALARLGAPVAWAAKGIRAIPFVGNTLTRGVRDAYAGQNEAVLDALANRLLNPDAAAPGLNRLVPAQGRQDFDGANLLLTVPGADVVNRRRLDPAVRQ